MSAPRRRSNRPGDAVPAGGSLRLALLVVVWALLLAGATVVGSESHSDAEPSATDGEAVAGMAAGDLSGERPAIADREAFGVIVIGSAVDQETLPLLLDRLGARWWYSFGEGSLDVPGYPRVQVVRTAADAPVDVAALAAQAALAPGSFWMIGNEPNVGGQDDVAPEVYAVRFQEAAEAIRAADATAVLVAPNVLNWETLCYDTCTWNRTGRWFVDGFRQAYLELYGEEPPVDVWGIHVYELNWQRLPMDDVTLIGQELEAFRAYLDDSSAQQGRPIWLTEFGVIWAYDGLIWEPRQDGSWRQLPDGTYRADRMEQYVRDAAGWLRSNADRLGIGRWFLYGTFPPPEPYMTSPAGLALLEGPEPWAPLSPAGWAYAEVEDLSSPPEPR